MTRIVSVASVTFARVGQQAFRSVQGREGVTWAVVGTWFGHVCGKSGRGAGCLRARKSVGQLAIDGGVSRYVCIKRKIWLERHLVVRARLRLRLDKADFTCHPLFSI